MNRSMETYCLCTNIVSTYDTRLRPTTSIQHTILNSKYFLSTQILRAVAGGRLVSHRCSYLLYLLNKIVRNFEVQYSRHALLNPLFHCAKTLWILRFGRTRITFGQSRKRKFNFNTQNNIPDSSSNSNSCEARHIFFFFFSPVSMP